MLPIHIFIAKHHYYVPVVVYIVYFLTTAYYHSVHSNAVFPATECFTVITKNYA